MLRQAEAKEASPEFQARPPNPHTAWHTLLEGINALAKERGLIKKAFICYTWPSEGTERNTLHAFLKRLQNDFERAGIQTFLDVRDIQGNMDAVMRDNLTTSNFVLPILTPAFLARVEEQGAKRNNLQFEFQLMMEKAKDNPTCIVPILYAGGFREVVQGVLSPLAKQLVYRLQANTRLEPYLVGLSDPLGLIPVMYGIRFNDPAYQALHLTWLESSLTSLPLPLPHAIARDNQMAALFRSSRPPLPHEAHSIPSSIQVIQGMGGVGKTQLAILYANRQTQEKEFVRWLMADKEHLEAEWHRLGELLGLNLKGQSIEEQHCAIQVALSQRPDWLLVLDNVENKAALKGLLPKRLLPAQQVLITTRSQHWGNDPLLVLPPFTLEECQEYFGTRLAPPQCIGVEELSQELGTLPLAIAHAVAYIQQTEKTAKSYLQLYREKGIALLVKADVKSEADEVDYNTMMLTMYQLSITALASQHPQAAELVKSCAYFHPEGIKKYFLKKLLNIEEKPFDDCLHAIREYSLLSKGDRGFNMHRLVQQIIHHQLPVEERERHITRVVQCLTALYPDTGGNVAVELRRKAVMPHLEAIITHHDQNAIENEHLALALSQLGSIYLYQLGRPQKSICLYERTLKIQEAHYGRDHYEVAATLGNFGNAYGALGDTARKRDLLERSLAIKEAHYGRDHYEVAITLTNLGNAYGALGDTARKRDLLERALVILEAHYGRDHYQVAATLGNLSTAYGTLGDTARKRDLLERALVILEAHYGRDHYQVAATLGNLGNAYGDLGDTARCRDLLERALAIQEAHYGREHYEVAKTLMNLGNAYGDLGDTARKCDLLERALKIEEAHYGREHSETAITLTNLGNAYGALGDTARKRDLLERALAIQEVHYGRDHSELAIILTNLAVAYHTLKQPRHALQTAQRAYCILMNHPQRGADHPTTRQCIYYLKSICRFTLEDLQGRKAISDEDVFSLTHYSGTLLNQGQGQKRRVSVAFEEEKAEQNNHSKQNRGVLLLD
ncbi:MAG: hypothetical protein K0R24_2042 [Gammaproteobacteria bacterium]|jgi:tetratricopeptide (TPR) repeat protein|nr:hypothetical protein [Gammaproteobacteria bacterium]